MIQIFLDMVIRNPHLIDLFVDLLNPICHLQYGKVLQTSKGGGQTWKKLQAALADILSEITLF